MSNSETNSNKSTSSKPTASSVKDSAFEEYSAILASWALRRPVTTCMIFLSLLLMGLLSSRLLPLEKFPGIDIPELYINVPYPNSTPTEVERLITRPVEEAIATISGIKELRSYSNEFGADIGIEFSWDENINAKSIEVREKVDAIKHLLPEDVERTLIYQFNTSDMPIFTIRISSQQDLSLAYDLLDRHLKKPIERVQGVSKVEMYGVNKRQIAIRLISDKLIGFKLSPEAVAQKLNEYNFSMSAGHFYDNGNKVYVNPVGEYQSLDDIRNIKITPSITLGDIANVNLELPRQREGRHLDKTYAIGMNILKDSNANLVKVADDVLAVIDKVGENPQFNGINLYVMDNTAEGVTTSLSDLLNAGLLGALLSIIVLYLFLRRLALTLVVVLSVPFSICITLGIMYFAGYSLNILSMMGLLLAVGMLVDNSVVISESIFQEQQAHPDKDKITTTKAGVSKVALAVIAGTATTMIVFLPNIIGQKVQLTIFLEHVAIAICISLAASLVIAQTLIPLLLSKLNVNPNTKSTKPDGTQKRQRSRLHKLYLKGLSWTQTRKKTTWWLTLALLMSIAIPMQFVSGDEENNFDDNRIFMRFTSESNISLEDAEKVINKMEDYLYANKEAFYLDSVYSFYAANEMQLTMILQEGDLPITMKALKDKIREGMPKFVRAKPQFGFNRGNGGGVQINLTGNSTQVLLELANNIIPLLENIEGLEDVTTELSGQQKELQIQIDRTRVFRLGLSTREVANAISLALRGQNLRTYRHGNNGEVDIRLSYDKEIDRSLDELARLPVLQQGDTVITLSNVASLKVAPRLNQVRRYNRQTAIEINGNLEELTLDEAREAINKVFEQITLPSGYHYSLDGSFRNQRQSENVMQQNMLLAICMIYIVMAALFESLLLPTAVITSLIFSFVGVYWAFFITGTPMSVIGMIGMLVLMGIVVNNGIVLVDRINQLLAQGQPINRAIYNACDNRFRPILMTVSTTILGLIPLAIGNSSIGGDGPSYSPMAIAIIGGLSLSTVTSLFLIPLIYAFLLKLRKNTFALIKHGKLKVSRYLPA